MRILRGTLPAKLLLAALCAVAAGEAGATIIIPEGTELPEDIRNPADPVELGSWSIPFTYPGDNNWYIYAHTETAELLGLALHEPPDPEAEAVEIPEGVEIIIPGFFEQMPNVKRVRIPDSVRSLSMECFAGVHWDFVIECKPGSYAEAFALEYGFQYDNGEKQVIGWQITDPEEKVRWVVDHYVREDMTEREKAWVLHNWIITNHHYWNGSEESYDSATLLTQGYGVCEAYSFAYYYLLKEAGMAVAWFSGDGGEAEVGDAGHQWNLVRVDGQWYHVDCTWDDPTSGPPELPCVSGQERNKYFLLTDAEMSEDHSWDKDYSADRGKMFSYWDPESGKEWRRNSWDADFTYTDAPEI